MRPGCSSARVPNCSAITSGEWLGSITPPEPSRMERVLAATWAISTAVADEAMVDSLSNLPNRRAVRRELDRRLKRGERLALALIDLDGFKGINDNYGHHVGDRLIKSIAMLLQELVGKNGMIARLGGDRKSVV